MVFSSVPAYLDHPNWNQQQPLHQLPAAGAAGGDASHQLLPGLGAARSEAAMAAAAGGGGAARAISMTERARLAKIVPQPEQPLKCPRCDSTNTKFCYFNNYSLTQPRHFCKTCRRYWTRGGALRNVPVGGGCRRNKRSKSSSGGGSGGGSSKSTVIASAAADRQAAGASSSSSTAGGGGVIPASITHPGQLPFLTSMHTLAGGDYGAPNLGLNFPGIPSIDAAEYQAANSNSSTVGLDQWRLPQIQQFPLLGTMEPPPPPQALYHFSVDGTAASRVLPKVSGSSLITQLASVKMEDSHLPRHYLGLAGNEQYNWSSTNTGEGGSSSSAGWGTTTDLSGFNSSSSGNIL